MILVTGGTGFVGRHLVSALVARGLAVRVLSRTGRSVWGAAPVEMASGDMMNPASLERATNGVSTVIHLAARVGDAGASPAHGFDFNVKATSGVAAAARAAGATRFVLMSSGGVYGDGRTQDPHSETDTPDPGNAYERSKLAAEGALVTELGETEISYTILRPAGVFGPDRPATVSFFREVRLRRIWLHSNANVVVHPTHVSDVVQACLRVLDSPRMEPTVFNVAGERAVRFHEWVGMTAEALRVRVRQVVAPSWSASVVRRTTDALAFTGLEMPRALERAGRIVINRSLDTTRARTVLGFVPTSLDMALRDSAAAFA